MAPRPVQHAGTSRPRPVAGRPSEKFAFECWDDGRLTVNRAFADVLADAGLTTFDSLWSYTGGRVAKNLLRERTTTRIVLPDDGNGPHAAFYLKRHAPPPWKEYVKPLIRLRWPLLGARHEWSAILRFHEIGIATMTPVALGRSGGRSLLLTKAIEGCRKLSDLLAECRGRASSRSSGASASGGDDTPTRPLDSLLRRIAAAARTLHRAGLHHQDFYLTHLLVPEPDDGETLYVIDLGRVRQRRRLASRWIVKDLAQLNYSACGMTESDRRRFLELYLDRPLTAADERPIGRIERKTRAIARHSHKNRL
ncbi:MAG TPA: lipopolysaccharide kinase InaA family protein [Planctomycetaceae bacterium]|nr:lipopolysaccharide kinase InaA family protein [Planctomycetaceae bacterium]